MARAGHVAVRQFVQQQHAARLGSAPGQRGVEVELAQRLPAVLALLERQRRQVAGDGGGVAAAVGLDDADAHRPALALRRVGGGQHREGLAHAGVGAEEDLQPAAPGAVLVATDLGQQLVGVGPRVAHSQRRRLKRQYSAPLTSAMVASAIG